MCRRLRLGTEARAVFRRRQFTAQNHLEGDDALETALMCFVNHAHAAAADLFEQFIIAEDFRCERRKLLSRRLTPPESRLWGFTPSAQGMCEFLSKQHGAPQFTQFSGEVGILDSDGVKVGCLPATSLLT